MNETYRLAEQYLQKTWNNLPLWFPIMGSHVRRLGFLRVLIGALGMYLSIPVFMLVHTFVIGLMVRWIVCPFLGLEDFSSRNYIIVDRYKVKGLSAIDKFNCLFCGWANGMCVLLNEFVDKISEQPQKLGLFYKTALFILCLVFTIPALVFQTAFYFIYNYIIAESLRLKKVYYKELIEEYFTENKYALKHAPLARGFIRYQKVTWMALSQALRQIESGWCPIKHFERMESVVYPAHHKLFFEPHQVDQLRHFLTQHTSVLERE